MWSFIQERLTARGSVPDKASMDYNQVREIYAILQAEERLFREMAQIAFLKKELNAMGTFTAINS